MTPEEQTDWEREAGILKMQLDDARTTNRLLHRRVQAAEGPLLSKIEWLEWEVDHYKRTAQRAWEREHRMRQIASEPRPEHWAARLRGLLAK